MHMLTGCRHLVELKIRVFRPHLCLGARRAKLGRNIAERRGEHFMLHKLSEISSVDRHQQSK